MGEIVSIVEDIYTSRVEDDLILTVIMFTFVHST